MDYLDKPDPQTFIAHPEYGNSLGSFMNCRRCTFAYELSRRGYDVQATKTLIGTGQDANGMNQMLFVPRFTKKRVQGSLECIYS